jgi:hypothetical protein
MTEGDADWLNSTPTGRPYLAVDRWRRNEQSLSDQICQSRKATVHACGCMWVHVGAQHGRVAPVAGSLHACMQCVRGC